MKFNFSEIVNNVICENDMSEKVFTVKKYLDQNFKPANYNQICKKKGEIKVNGSPDLRHPDEIVAMIDKEGNIVGAKTDVQLFYHLQDKFQHMFGDKKERDEFLKDVIKKWYRNKISKHGTLMNN